MYSGKLHPMCKFVLSPEFRELDPEQRQDGNVTVLAYMFEVCFWDREGAPDLQSPLEQTSQYRAWYARTQRPQPALISGGSQSP